MRFILTSKFYEVENKSPHHKAESTYFYCKDSSNKDYLFTSSALREANDRATRHSEDIPNLDVYNIALILKEKERLQSENLEFYEEIIKLDKVILYYRIICAALICGLGACALNLYFKMV